MEAVDVQLTTTTTAAAAPHGGPCGGHGDDDGGPKDLTLVVKGKRTKRQRPQSPIPFTIPTHYNNNNINNNNSSTSYSSPATSSDFPAGSTTTEEQDTAECLILLSRGPSKNYEDFSTYKFNSKRYIQTSTAGGGATAGIYVYECKTCSRTFPSFQALGGHRASHKKPKNNDDRKLPPYTAVSDDDEPPPPPPRKNNSSSSSSLSLQLNNRVSSNGNTNKSSKLHECSICGTEFNSGQALGGHMRRHRVVGGGATTTATNHHPNTTLSLVPYIPPTTVAVADQDNQKSKNDGLCLDLDLNLPAPADAAGNQDQRRDTSFTLSSNQKKQQSAVNLSANQTLVDCHY